ncbi:MAG TPA: AraC family transcriptional regulator [Nocardioides sp.]|uniref:AraC family transcriptional regulator n=1 Tax=Nocardioides sp. TaxID=35761 RepID=UPI002EDA0B22
MSAAAAGCGGPSPDSPRPRPTPHLRCATDDRDEAETVVSKLYLPNRLELRKGSVPLGMEVAGLRLGALTVGQLSYAREVRLRTADAQNVHVNIPLRGRVLSKSGSGEPATTGPGEGLVFPPNEPAEISWSPHAQQLCLMIPQDALEAELEKLLGRHLRGRLIFDFAADLSNPLGRRWRTVLELLVDELDRPTDMGQNPLVGRHLERLVIDGLLLGQKHNHTDAMVHDRPAPMGAAIRHAVELIEDRPSEPWTAVSLASEVHLSVRALQEGFRRDVATTPMTYLRQVRLRRAREALQAAHRDTTTVNAVAAGLGILHMGRFAASYRQAFGESPSDTLNQPP